MKTLKPLSKSVFGLCVITVSLCSGCATAPDRARVPMHVDDMNRYQISCRDKQRQTEQLQSMRTTQNEEFAARARIALQPWRMFTDPAAHDADASVGWGNTNMYVNDKLFRLSLCGN
jgi:hypothetical protein